MSSIYGEKLKLSIFGQSHSRAIGMCLDGIPAGLKVNFKELQKFMQRRAPGQNSYSTSRCEQDVPEFLSGISNDFTCGAPICAIIKNHNIKPDDYENIKDCPRPGHADYTAQIKYKGFQDRSGGGHFSGRLTAPLCIAGGLCKQWLSERGIQVGAHIASIGSCNDRLFDPINPELSLVSSDFPVINTSVSGKMKEIIDSARAEQDSIGGTIECAVTGLPAGLGDPMFDGAENRIAKIIFGIPAVKGLEFGSGFSGSEKKGSENNDPYSIVNGRICILSNNSGGILGGITNGMPLLFKVAVKPTPSIGKSQKSISMSTLENKELIIKGRHDPCIVPRAVPVVEAAAAIAVMDMII